jgi:hypothetical protein
MLWALSEQRRGGVNELLEITTTIRGPDEAEFHLTATVYPDACSPARHAAKIRVPDEIFKLDALLSDSGGVKPMIFQLLHADFEVRHISSFEMPSC